MSYMQAMAPCYCYGRLFSFNPDLVPSIRINGIKEPICQACVEAANPKRIANGLEPIHVLPGAYEAQEVCDLCKEYGDSIMEEAAELG